MNILEQNLILIRMSSQPKRKLTRKRLNNALAQVYREHPEYFTTPPTKMSFFQHVHDGNIDDVKEFLEEADFNINMRDPAGNTALFYAMDGAGGLPMVELLVENGADINSMNNIGEVPFHVLCYNPTSLTKDQIKIARYMIDQSNLILFPFNGRNLEQIFLHATDDITSFQRWYINASDNQLEEPISFENAERARREGEIEQDIVHLYYEISYISDDHVHYVNVVPSDAKQKTYHFLDTRMTGAQLVEYMQKQVFKNKSMKLDMLFRGGLLDLQAPLADQGIGSDSTITFQIRLVSGFQSLVGGKRKTRRHRR